MTKQFVCDVCGEPFELDQPHIEFVVQEGMEGAVPDGSWDVCSWTCMYDLTLAASSTDVADAEEDPEILRMRAVLEAEEIPEGMGKRIMDEVHLQQIVIDKQDRQYAKEVEDAGTGVYFPEGMRVDGRPAEQVRRRQVPKVRLVRDDD